MVEPVLFVSLGGWFAASWGKLVLADLHRDCWEPGMDSSADFPWGCVSVLCQDFAPKLDLNLIYRLSDLLNCFELLCGIGGYDVSPIWVHPGLFDRGLLPPALFDMGTLHVSLLCHMMHHVFTYAKHW